MTDLFVAQVRYSALKAMIKCQTLSLQASNAGGFEQPTSGAQTVARKALWSGPRSNFYWKENLTL